MHGSILLPSLDSEPFFVTSDVFEKYQPFASDPFGILERAPSTDVFRLLCEDGIEPYLQLCVLKPRGAVLRYDLIAGNWYSWSQGKATPVATMQSRLPDGVHQEKWRTIIEHCRQHRILDPFRPSLTRPDLKPTRVRPEVFVKSPLVSQIHVRPIVDKLAHPDNIVWMYPASANVIFIVIGTEPTEITTVAMAANGSTSTFGVWYTHQVHSDGYYPNTCTPDGRGFLEYFLPFSIMDDWPDNKKR